MINNQSLSYRAETDFARKFFYGFLIIHGILWIVGPALLRYSLPHDSLESISWGLQWQWGYNKHPFLAAWLSAGFTYLFSSPDWAMYLLAQLSLSLTFISVWRLARKFLPEIHAIVAALILEGVTFYNINSFNFTPDMLQLPLWALLCLFAYRSFDKGSSSDWLLTGLFAGLAILCKYQSGLILLSIGLFSTTNSKARVAYKQPGIYLALAVVMSLLLPHVYWLWQHDFITIYYALAGGVEQGRVGHIWLNPVKFILSVFSAILGLLILLWPFYQAEKTPLKLSRFQNSFLLWAGLGPLVLTLLLSVLSLAHFPPRWASPYFNLLGILAFVYLKPVVTKQKLKQFLISLIILSLLLWTGRMASLSFFQRARSDAWLPNKEIAETIEQLWAEQNSQAIAYLGGSHYLIANILPYMKHKPQPYFNFSATESPWINRTSLNQQGAILLWDLDKKYDWDKSQEKLRFDSTVLKAAFPHVKIMGIYRFYTHSKKKSSLNIGIAVLKPANK